jgi:hypothetical protein
MREDVILERILGDIINAVPNTVDVRVAGGDEDVDVPEVILEWRAVKQENANGHSPFAGMDTDQNGNHVARFFHAYYEMQIELTVRHPDEIEKDKIAHDIITALLPYEYNATAFDPETRLWSVGDITANENPVVEPDWFESAVLVDFEYIKEVREDAPDYIESIEKQITPE